jgi:hypothetical protein
MLTRLMFARFGQLQFVSPVTVVSCLDFAFQQLVAVAMSPKVEALPQV